jgi:hypothetical protein
MYIYQYRPKGPKNGSLLTNEETGCEQERMREILEEVWARSRHERWKGFWNLKVSALSLKFSFCNCSDGTGKTLVEIYLLVKIRPREKIALAVLSSGIVALLLLGGEIAHSRFKTSVKLTGDSSLPIAKLSQLYEPKRLCSVGQSRGVCRSLV